MSKTNSMKGRGIALLAVYAAFVALPLAIVFLHTRSGGPFLTELGKGTGLLGFSLLTAQFILSARLPWIEQPYGLDAIMSFHKGMGILAGGLILLHPLLLALGHGDWSLLSLTTPWEITLGKVAALLLVITIALALLVRRIKLDYNTWRLLHKGALLVLLLGFLHSVLVGSDLQDAAVRWYWGGLLTIAVAAFLYRNLYVPWRGRGRWHLTDITQENYNTWTLAFTPADGQSEIDHRPGQFWFVKLQPEGRRSEEHPFTISSSSTGEPPITSTVKESGNFTEHIGSLRPGASVAIEGPFGRFSAGMAEAECFLLIAGGVGITPIISMLRRLRDTDDQRPVTLIDANNQERDILFRDELADLPGHINIVHVLSEPSDDWSGPTGYVTTDLIRTTLDESDGNVEVYLCGPPPMMDQACRSLAELGIPGRRIHSERFTL